MRKLVVDVSPSYSNTQGKAVQHSRHCILQPGSRTPAEDAVGRTLELRERTVVSGTQTYVDTNPAKATARGKNDANAVGGADTVAPVEVVAAEGDNTLLHQADTCRWFELA